MIPCNSNCKIYNTCDAKGLRKRCIYDMGIYVKEEEDDEFLEKITY
jgi:hypothetical protein